MMYVYSIDYKIVAIMILVEILVIGLFVYAAFI
jgi:hypothetical protein